VKLAFVLWVVAGGPSSIVVSGATVSTVKARLAGPPVLPAASAARTSKVCAPSASVAVVCGDEQSASAAASTRHWKLAPASLENDSVGVESFVSPSGPEPIVVTGPTVSTVKARLAGAPVLPAASAARTSKVCAPSASVAVVWGDEQSASAAASTRHWKLVPSALENENVGVESLVSELGPASIEVTGASVSTVNARLARSLVLPAASVAITSKV
jgi:hypothetical protein